MSVTTAPVDWVAWNQRVLADEITAMRARLEAFAEGRDMPAPFVRPDGDLVSAIDRVRALFGLSEFERAVVVLCAAIELDGSFASVCAAAHNDPARNYPTFGLALAALPGAHWSAIAPGAALRRTPLIAVGSGATVTSAPIRIEERIVHYLVGIDAIDERLAPFVDRIGERSLVPSHATIAARIGSLWEKPEAAVVVLTGRDGSAKRSIAAQAAASIGATAFAARADALPRDARDLDAVATLWNRESRLSRGVLILECEGDATSAEPEAAARVFVDRAPAPVIVSTTGRWRAGRRATVSLDVGRPTAHEQRSLWASTLAKQGGAQADVERLVAQFDVGADTIEATCATALTDAPRDGDLTRTLWETCLRAVSPSLDDLAQRIAPRAGWDDLVLPVAQRALLLEISRRASHRWRVYEEWGFGSTGARGRGVTALFAGGSGTGKTLAAEVLAGALGVDCYRIDLSQVVSKYIGETEKNLRRVFDAAEDGGAVLLFDEADALFGKRSEVRDSHDRYANIEISFLLQRMESYRGLAILTTNMKEALDHAFTRRLGFIVHFPFPDEALRAEIWRRVFPPETPTDGIDHDALARINVSGGTIRNIALTAAFGAAESGSPIGMSHVIDAARQEFGKLERSFSDLDLEVVP